MKGYKVTFHPTEDDGSLGELIVGPYDSTVVLEELRYGYSLMLVFDLVCFVFLHLNNFSLGFCLIMVWY